MKKTFSKFLATAAAVSMLASVATVVNADEAAASFEYRTVEAGAIITGVANADDVTTLDIPTEAVVGDKTLAVVGIDDFAFADLDNLTTINASTSLQPEFMGNVAFMTKKSIAAYLAKELGEDADKDALVAYIAAKIEYAGKTEGWTADELAEVEAKAKNKAALAGVTLTDDMDNAAVVDAVVTMLQNQDAMGLSTTTNDKLAIWETTVTYSDTFVNVDPEAPIAAIVDALAAKGLNEIKGDANNDGELSVRDCAFIANKLAKKLEAELPAKADYNEDGEVSVRDAAAIARDLAKASK